MKVLFVGPSLGGGLAAARNMSPCIDFRPPAACGDILKAVEDGATAIGLVDGYFGDLPSVWHKEILYALEQDVAVAGGASMGALRAAECAPFGMVGLGSIFEDYQSGRLLDDEAVALVHAPQALGWLPLSVPWVDFEPTINALHAGGEISSGERKKLLLSGRFLHFSERTYARVVDECHFRKPRRDLVLAACARTGSNASGTTRGWCWNGCAGTNSCPSTVTGTLPRPLTGSFCTPKSRAMRLL